MKANGSILAGRFRLCNIICSSAFARRNCGRESCHNVWSALKTVLGRFLLRGSFRCVEGFLKHLMLTPAPRKPTDGQSRGSCITFFCFRRCQRLLAHITLGSSSFGSFRSSPTGAFSATLPSFVVPSLLFENQPPLDEPFEAASDKRDLLAAASDVPRLNNASGGQISQVGSK